MGRVVLTPVGKASDQGSVVGIVVQFHQPIGAGAMLGGEHHQQGGDDAGAVDHGSFALTLLVWHRMGGGGAIGGHLPNWHSRGRKFVILRRDDNQSI